MNAAEMINRCYRHQTPEAFGGDPVLVPNVDIHNSTEQHRPCVGHLTASDEGITGYRALPFGSDLPLTVDET